MYEYVFLAPPQNDIVECVPNQKEKYHREQGNSGIRVECEIVKKIRIIAIEEMLEPRHSFFASREREIIFAR